VCSWTSEQVRRAILEAVKRGEYDRAQALLQTFVPDGSAILASLALDLAERRCR